MSRRSKYRRPMGDDIDRINAAEMDRLRFADFHNLKCGRDEFSRLKFPALCERVSRPDLDAIESRFPDDRDRASCLRWILRGLELSRAIRKVATDAEVRGNAIGSSYEMETRAFERELARHK